MRYKNKVSLITIGVLLILLLSGSPASASSFILFPGTPSATLVLCEDVPGSGCIMFFKDLAIPTIPGAKFSGEFQVTSEKNFARITITQGIISNETNQVLQGSVDFASVGYNFDPGDGVLRTDLNAILNDADVKDRIKSVSTRASASSFDQNPATANWAETFTVGGTIVSHPISPNMPGMPVRNGRYSGNGTLTATLIFTGLDPLGSISFPDSAVYEAAVPEPTTVLLLTTGIAGVALKMRKRRKRNQQ